MPLTKRRYAQVQLRQASEIAARSYLAFHDGIEPTRSEIIEFMSQAERLHLPFSLSKSQIRTLGLRSMPKRDAVLYRTGHSSRMLSYWNLTPREQEVGKLIWEGKSRNEIASDLKIASGTVKTYINRIYGKAGISGIAELIVFMEQNLPLHVRTDARLLRR